MLLRVDAKSGRLLVPLADGTPDGAPDSRPLLGGGDKAISAIFVLSHEGDLFLTTAQAIGRFHHSSFVAGAPVAAAGEMTVHHGQVLALSNRSGHYMPPRACLGRVLEKLRQMGVADLDRVQIEPATPPPASIELRDGGSVAEPSEDAAEDVELGQARV